MKEEPFDITASEIEERYKTMKPIPDPLTELCIERIAKLMEEMAGQPKEELGKRQPGEKCIYELQRIENANNRI